MVTLIHKYRWIIIIVFVSLIPLFTLYTSNKLIHTHDGLVHLPRLAAYYKALSDGQIPPRFAGELNYGYGMPLFIFIYHTPYIIGSLFLKLGFTLVNAFKITLGLSYVLSGFFMYGFSRVFFKDEKKAVLVTFLYQFAPFRLVEVIVRGSFGEVYTYTFLPLVLWSLVLIIDKFNIKRLVFTSIAVFLLILSHNSVSLTFFVVSALFAVWFGKTIKKKFIGLFGLISGLLLAAFYWIPAIVEHKFTYGDMFMKDIYKDHFPAIYKFFVPNILNSERLYVEGISVDFGLIHIAAIFAAVYLLIKKRVSAKTRAIYYYSFALLLGSLFIMQPVSKVLWENVSLLRQFQFPWRFLSVVVFASSILGVSLLSFKMLVKSNVRYYLLLAVIVAITVFYWYPREGFDEINENYYWNFPLNTTYYGETDVVWSDGPAYEYPDSQVEIIAGKAEILLGMRKSQIHTFSIVADTDVTVVDHTQYFPGWRVFVNGEKTQIEFQDTNWPGEITFQVPKGKHDIMVEFGRSKTRFVAEAVSVATFTLLVLLWVRFQFFQNLTKKD